MELGKVGDRAIVESEHVGDAAREGEILEVLGTGDGIHYRIRWEDGHESTFYPSAGSISFRHRSAAAGTRSSRH
jgi:hypothetical protein